MTIKEIKKITEKETESTPIEEKKLTKADEKQITVIERVIENREIAPHDAFGKLNRAQVELIKRTYAKGASDDELKLFITVCHGLQLSPFSKQVHLVPRWDSKAGTNVMAIQVGIDGFRATAEKTGKYAGNDDPIFDGEKEIEIGERKQKITVPEKATVTVWKIVEGQRYGFTATARWSEYYPGPKMGFQWHQKPFLMLGKCAESMALRKGFPTLLSGIYTPEEMDQGRKESTEAERAQNGVNTLKKVIKTASPEECEDYRKKLEKSDKYTPTQKVELNKLIDERLVEFSKELDKQA